MLIRAHRISPCLLVAALLLITAAPALADGFRPDRLVLTWQRDPTTTMTVQWLQQGQPLAVVEDEQPQPIVFDIPRVEGDEVQGAPAQWWDRGLPLNLMADHRHRVPEDFSAVARLGWSEQGLRLLVQVRSRHAAEDADISRLWNADSVEVFVGDAVGSNNRYQLVAAPGWDPQQSAPRHFFHGRSEDRSVQMDARRTAGGWLMEMLLPWTNLEGFQAEDGATFSFQLHVNDRNESGSRRIRLHPGPNSSGNPNSAHPFRLARQAGPPVQARAEVDQNNDRLAAHVYGAADLVGRVVTVHSGHRRLGQGTFESRDGLARAVVDLPSPPAGRQWGMLQARLGEQPIAVMQSVPMFGGTPDPVEVRYWAAGSDQLRTATTRATPVRQWPGMFTQRIELNGLTPDTEYRFQAAGHPDDYGFRTMPAALTRPIRLAIGGDTRHSQQLMERTNRVAMQHRPDLIVWGGDLAYADGRQDRLERWEEWFDANYSTLIDAQRRMTPIVVGIGNHEVQEGYYTRHEGFQPTDEWRARIAPYFYSIFAFPGQPGYNVLDFGDYLSLVILDTDHTNPVEGRQTRWLQNVLEQRRQVPHVFPVYHVPAWPSHRSFDDPTSARVRQHWLGLFERNGIRLAFENHDHTYKRTPPIRSGRVDPSGIVYIGDGAWGVGTRPVHNPSETWYLERAESVRHCIILTLTPSQQHVAVYSEEGRLIDEYTVTLP